MKKFWIVVVFCMTIVSCERQDPMDPNPSTIKPKVELIISPDEIIPYGGIASVKWNSDAKNVTLNKIIVNSQSESNVKLFSDSTFELIATNGTVSNSIKKVAKVGDWKTSKIGLLTYMPWMLRSIKYIQNGKVVFDFKLNNEQLTNIFYYCLDGKAFCIKANGEKTPFTEWSFLENERKFKSGNNITTIKVLSQSEFIFYFDVESDDGTPTQGEMSYYRPQ